MKLIFLYGPAGVGKQTVGEILAEQTGYKLLHLHQIFNPLSDIFGMRSDQRWALGREFRLRIFEEAAKAGIDMITTFGGGAEEFDFFYMVRDVVESNDGTVCFVKLEADRSEILKRISSPSRKDHKKLTTKSEFEDYVKRFPGVFETYPRGEHLRIDTSHLTARDTAEKVIAYYALL